MAEGEIKGFAEVDKVIYDELPQMSKAMVIKLDGIESILSVKMTPLQRTLMAVYLDRDVPPEPVKKEVTYLRKPRRKK